MSIRIYEYAGCSTCSKTLKNGKLIKRPFLLTDKGGATGFDAERWDALV